VVMAVWHWYWCHQSTCSPSHGQLRMRLGVDGMLFELPLFSLSPCSTPHPPCKQGLAAVVGGVASPLCSRSRFPISALSSSFYLCSAPQAVSRGAGGGWCVIPCPSLPSFPYLTPLPPIHLLPLGCRRCSTHHPPHKQLLARLEVGGVLFVPLHWCWHSLAYTGIGIWLPYVGIAIIPPTIQPMSSGS
jgi:hypothetical protein